MIRIKRRREETKEEKKELEIIRNVENVSKDVDVIIKYVKKHQSRDRTISDVITYLESCADINQSFAVFEKKIINPLKFQNKKRIKIPKEKIAFINALLNLKTMFSIYTNKEEILKRLHEEINYLQCNDTEATDTEVTDTEEEYDNVVEQPNKRLKRANSVVSLRPNIDQNLIL